ncbi:MAG: CHAT domain-containing protein, partial [Terracidiphilus sp.]
MGPVPCTAQTAGSAPRSAQTPIVLNPGETVSAEVPAKGKETFTIAACADCFTEVLVEQMHESMPMATLSGPGIVDPVPRFCDAGIHSVVRVPFISPQSGNYELEIRLARPATEMVRITLAASRPATASDRDVVSAYDALARAEALRRASAADSAPKTISAYDQAIQLAQIIGDMRLRQKALIGKTRIYLYQLGDYTAALKTAEEARALMGNRAGSPQQSDLAIDAATWKVLSSAYYFLARYPEMIDATNRSLAIYASLGDLYWEGILEGNIASVYAEIGEMQLALAAAERALDIARQLSDPGGITFSQATIAAIYLARAEYQTAVDADQAALEEIRIQPYPDEEGQVWLNLAEIYDELNDFAREHDALQRSLPLLRKVGDGASESTALSDLSLLDMRQGHWRDAEQALDQAMEIARSQQLHREQAVAFLRQAVLFAAEGHRQAAADAVRNGLALTQKTGEVATSAMLLQEKGDLYAHERQNKSALAAYRQAESEWSGIPNLEHAALARASIARIEMRQGEMIQARNDILEALDGFEASRRNAGGRSLRESYFASVHDFYDLAIEIAMSPQLRRAAASTASGASGSDNADVETWTIAERARARSLIDAIRQSSDFTTRGVPAELIDRSENVEREIGEAQQQILKLGSQDGGKPGLQEAKNQLHALVVEADEIEAREREASSLSLFGVAVRPPSIATVRAQLLDPGTELLEYWAGKDSVYLWTVTAHSVHATRLCSATDLSAAVSAYRNALLAREVQPSNEELAERQARIARGDRELNRQAAILGKMLLPVRPPSQIRRLVIVPDGLIASIPFAALRLEESSEFLIEDYELIEEPSASAAIELLSRPAPEANLDRIAVFADPVYNRLDPRLAQENANAVPERVSINTPNERSRAQAIAVPQVLRSDSDLDLDSLPRLHASAMEAQSIASIAGAGHVKLYLGFEATPDAATQAPWRDFAIAHFATHAIV